jgi:GNAT superfamily N-acetyltransferase
MRYLDRPYDDGAGDFKRLWDFFVCDYADRDGVFSWTVGRMADWKFNLATPRKYSPMFASKSAHLWFDDLGELAGVAINENLDHEISVFPRRDSGHLFGRLIDWCAEQWAAHAEPWDPDAEAPATAETATCRRLVTYLNESERREAAALASRGWQDMGRASMTRRYDVAAISAEQAGPPDGFRVASAAEEANFSSKLRLYHDAWRHGPVTDTDLDLWEYCRTAPTYEAELDISVITPDGEHVAGCTAFPDYKNSYAEIERVCTRSDFRRRGLAVAAIAGCFRALVEVGVRTAYLTGFGEDAISLYGKLGPTAEWHSHAWQLILPPSSGRT